MLNKKQRAVLLEWVSEQRDQSAMHLFHKLCDDTVVKETENGNGGKEIVSIPSLAARWKLNGISLMDVEDAVAIVAERKRKLENR